MKKFLLGFFCALMAIIFLAQVSYAQEGGSKTANFSLEEVVVTAQKRMETQQEIPASFNVYSAENLEATGWADVKDMASLIPSMEVSGLTKSRTSVFIRSIGTNKFDIGTEGSIGVFVDGVYVSRFSSLMQNLIELERIEVLRGPQGTLYGRNTIGGAISLYGKGPQEQFGGTIKTGVSNKSTYEVSTSVTGPLLEDLLGSLAVIQRDTGGSRKDTVSGKTDDEFVRAARIKLDYWLTEDLNFRWAIEYSDSEVDAFLGEPFNPPGTTIFAIRDDTDAALIQSVIDEEAKDIYSSAMTTPGGTDVESLSTNVTFERAGEDLNFETIIGFRKEDVVEANDYDQYSFDIINSSTKQYSETYSLELKLSSETSGIYSMDDQLEWLVGFFGYVDNANRYDLLSLGEDSALMCFQQGGCSELPLFSDALAFGLLGLAQAGFVNPADIPSLVAEHSPTLIGPPPHNMGFLVDLKTTSWAVFSQVTYYFTDELSLTLGGRFSKDKKAFTYAAEQTEFETLANLSANTDNIFVNGVLNGLYGAIGQILQGNFTFEFDDELRFESTDPKVVLEYEPMDAEDLLFYLSYAQGYKSGGIQFIARTEDSGSESFDKEILIAWETGIKSRWFNQRLQFNGSIYFYEYEGQQVQAVQEVGGQQMAFTDNADKSIIVGVEWDAQFLATQDLLLQLSYSWMEAEFDKFVDRQGNDFEGNALSSAPANSFWFSAEYSYMMPGDWELTSRLDLSWRDDFFLTADNRFEQDAYGLVQLAFTLTDPDELWTLRAYCSNCADKDYYSAFTTLDVAGSGWASTGDRRRFGFEVKYHFGG